MPHPRWFALSLCAVALAFAGCAAQRQIVHLPYALPAAGTARPEAPSAILTTVTDARDDRLLNQFIEAPPADFLREAFAAELRAAGTCSTVTLRPAHEPPHPEDFRIELELRDASWAVPNHAKMAKTAFWTSFLTGGLGGLAYGSTEAKVYGHAAIAVKVTARATNAVLLDATFEHLHEEATSKFKCDTPTTQARVIAAALRGAVQKAAAAVAAKIAAGPSI